MKAQVKRIVAMLMVTLMIANSQSSTYSSLASFATGTRNVQAAEVTEEDGGESESEEIDDAADSAGGGEAQDAVEEAAEDEPEAADAEEAGGNAEAESEDEDETAESTESGDKASYEEESEEDADSASGDEYSSDEQQIEEEGEETSSGSAAGEAVQDDTADDADLQPETESQTEEVPAGMDSVFVTAVLGDSDDPISDAYTDVRVPVMEDTLDLTESPISEEVTRAVPVAGTQRLYVESFKYDYATIDGAQIISLAKKDITEDTVIYLHYSSAQIKTKYVYEDKDIKVTAVVQDPEVIPDNAILSVTQITEELNKAAQRKPYFFGYVVVLVFCF